MVVDALMDAVLDTVKLLPFLLLTYLLMEYLEQASEQKTRQLLEKAGIYGPFFGAVSGIIPQCGFSAAAASLFSGGIISMGTLLAVFLSTSDEMLPILLTSSAGMGPIARILFLKFLIGMLSGFAADFLLRRMSFGKGRASTKKIHDLCEREGCDCGKPGIPYAYDGHVHNGKGIMRMHSASHARTESASHARKDSASHARTESASHARTDSASHAHAESTSHARTESAFHTHTESVSHAHTDSASHAHTDPVSHAQMDSAPRSQMDLSAHSHKDSVNGVFHFLSDAWINIIRPAIHHTIQITIYIFIFNLVITLLVEGIGEDAIGSFLVGKPLAGVFLAGLVGLIPNCAASVALTKLWLMGMLSGGQMMAGLLVGAGVGLLVLFRTNDHPNENLLILLSLYGFGVFWGLLIQLLGLP